MTLPAYGRGDGYVQREAERSIPTMAKTASPAANVDLDVLDAFLLSDRAPEDSMGLSDLDGFLTGVIVGPELIQPSEWLPVIWGGDEPAFDDVGEAQTILGAIMGRYNTITANLDAIPAGFDPVFLESDGGRVFVSDWAAGFLDAIQLRAPAWDPLITHPEERSLVIPILLLGAVDDGRFRDGRPLSPDELEKLMESGPDLISACVIAIRAFWAEHGGQPSPKPARQRQRPDARRPRE